MKLRAGDWVEVRSKAEILASLDKSGQLDGLPFMPEMFRYCGKKFRVFKRAHKSCDTVNQTGGRRVSNAVHLELRCDGNAHGGCQAACLIFWNKTWLKPINDTMFESSSDEVSGSNARTTRDRCTEEDVLRATCIHDGQRGDDIRYVCQATQLPNYTTPLPWWDFRQYVEDFASGNVTFPRIFFGFVYCVSYYFCRYPRQRLGRPMRWLYNHFQAIWGGVPFPWMKGTIPAGQSTPTSTLDLQPGELVRIKSYKEILATIDTNNYNRGLHFDAEQVPYCGGIYRVKALVTNFIDEKSGKMKTMKTPAVMLDGVWCQSRYSNRRIFCPRSIHSWWREIWLERVSKEDRPTR